LISCTNLFCTVTVQIQTQYVRDHLGKENTTISLMDWKIIMFDHEGVKTKNGFQVFQSFFHMSNLKSWAPKKYEDKRPDMHNQSI